MDRDNDGKKNEGKKIIKINTRQKVEMRSGKAAEGPLAEVAWIGFLVDKSPAQKKFTMFSFTLII